MLLRQASHATEEAVGRTGGGHLCTVNWSRRKDVRVVSWRDESHISTFTVNFLATNNAYPPREGHALSNMHYASIFLGTSVVPTSKLCTMTNMH